MIVEALPQNAMPVAAKGLPTTQSWPQAETRGPFGNSSTIGRLQRERHRAWRAAEIQGGTVHP